MGRIAFGKQFRSSGFIQPFADVLEFFVNVLDGAASCKDGSFDAPHGGNLYRREQSAAIGKLLALKIGEDFVLPAHHLAMPKGRKMDVSENHYAITP